MQVQVAGKLPRLKGTGSGRRRRRAGILFLLPAFLVMAIFLAWPKYLGYLYFIDRHGTDWSRRGQSSNYVGLRNFDHILHDTNFFLVGARVADVSCRLGIDRAGLPGIAAGSADAQPQSYFQVGAWRNYRHSLGDSRHRGSVFCGELFSIAISLPARACSIPS